MVGLQNLDLPIGVRVPVSQPIFQPKKLPFLFAEMDKHETIVRVRYAETDKMGVAHHANYIVWFELGRSEFCRARGFSYSEMENENLLLVVGEIYCRYKSPAFYDDELIVRTSVQELKSRTMRFVYEIVRKSDETPIAEGETFHVVTDNKLKVRSITEKYKQAMLVEETSSANSALPADEAPH